MYEIFVNKDGWYLAWSEGPHIPSTFFATEEEARAEALIRNRREEEWRSQRAAWRHSKDDV